MKIKQLLCLGALMTLPMSMSAKTLIDVVDDDVAKIVDTAKNPIVVHCVTTYYVESSELYNDKEKQSAIQDVLEPKEDLKKETVSINVAKHKSESVVLIEFTFKNTTCEKTEPPQAFALTHAYIKESLAKILRNFYINIDKKNIHSVTYDADLTKQIILRLAENK